MTRETCATCRFFDAHEAPWTSGACRAHAPRAVMFDDKDETALAPRWPAVSGDIDWCGEHQPVAPAPAASDDYTRAAVRYAEAAARLSDALVRLGQASSGISAGYDGADEVDLEPLNDDVTATQIVHDDAEAAFLRLYRERHGV